MISVPLYVHLNILLLLGGGALCFILCCIPAGRKTYIKSAEQVYELPSVPVIPGIAKPTLPDTLLTLSYVAASTLMFYMGYYTSQFNPESVEEATITTLDAWMNVMLPVITCLPLIICYYGSAENLFKFKFKYFGAAIACIVLVNITNGILEISGYYEWLIHFTGTPGTQQAVESIQSAQPSLFLPNVVAAVIIAPFVEEIFFRGFIFRVLSNKVGITVAAIVSGVFFGAVHVSLLQTTILSVFGIIQCYLYVKSQSIIYPMIMHSLFNSFTLLLMFNAI